MRWLSKISSAIKPPLAALLLVTCLFAQNDKQSIASRLYRYGDSAKQLNGIYFVDTKYYPSIQAAITDAGTTGTVIIPSVYAGADTYTNPNSITIIDLRPGKTASTNISLAADTQLPTIQTAGKINGSALPVPSTSVLGGVKSKTCTGTDKISAIGTDGIPVCTADQTSGAGTGITSLNGLTSSSQTFAIGTSGNSPAFNSATSTHTLNIPMAHTGGVTAGLLSNSELLSLLTETPTGGVGANTIVPGDGTTDALTLVASGGTGNVFVAKNNGATVTFKIDSTGLPKFLSPTTGNGAPFTVASSDMVTNLNANFVGGKSYTQINPMTAKGAMLYSSDALGTPTALAPNTTTTPLVLISTGTGTLGNAPVWGSLTATMLPSQAFRTDQSNTISTGTQNFAASAETVPDKVGTLANRPASATNTGATYYASDTKTSYRWNGTSWQTEGTGGSGTLTSVVLPTTDFTVSGTTTLTFAWGGTNTTGAPTSTNTPNAIVKRDSSGNTAVAGLTATSVTVSGTGDSAVDIPTQSPCVPGAATFGRIMFDGTHLVVSENTGSCAAIVNAATALGGDLNGTVGTATITQLAGRTFDGTAPSTNDVLTWNGTKWTHLPPPAATVSSVFGRTGAVTAQSGDYTAAQVTNAFDITGSNDLTEIATPGSNPSAGKLRVYAKTTTEQICVLNSAGTETCYSAGGTPTLNSVLAPAANASFNMGGFNLAFTQTANSTGNTYSFTGFNGNPGAGHLVDIVAGGSTDTYQPLFVTGLNPAIVPATVKVAAAQTADSMDFLSSSGTVQASIGSGGGFKSTLSYGATAASTNMLFYGADSSTANLTGTATFRGGDYSGSAASRPGQAATLRGGDTGSSTGAGGALTIRGGDLLNATSATGAAGNVEIRPGANTIGGSTTNNGQLTVSQVYVKGATTAVGDVMCMSGSFTVTDCAANATNAVGVEIATIGTNALEVAGPGSIVTVNFDSSHTVSAGDRACTGSTGGKITPSSSACIVGQQIGFFVNGGTASSGPVVLIFR